MNQESPPRHKPLRLAGYDYAQAGTYVVTVVVQGRKCCLGSVENYAFRPTVAGDIVREVWERLPKRFPSIDLDAFVVMPNHVHGIVSLGAKPFSGGETAINGGATGEQDRVAPPFMADSHASSPAPGSQSNNLRPPSRDPTLPALGEVVRSLKAASTTRIRKEWMPDFKWQARYWDRIVRNDAELDRFRSYIFTNPERWTLDREFSER